MDELVPFLTDVDVVPIADRRRRTAWTLLTVILCAAMVLLGAGLLPMALAPASGPDRLPGLAAPHSAPTSGS